MNADAVLPLIGKDIAGQPEDHIGRSISRIEMAPDPYIFNNVIVRGMLVHKERAKVFAFSINPERFCTDTEFRRDEIDNMYEKFQEAIS